jgi:hypothetical protein
MDRKLDAVSRRDFLRAGTLAAMGLGLGSHLHAASAAKPAAARCESVVLLWMQGGVSHLDTFDPKPHAPAEVRGEFRAIPTCVAGIQLCEHLPRMARIADKIAFIRSMHHPEGAHERGMSYMLSGFNPTPAVNHPSLGSVVMKELGPRRGMPPYVTLPGTSFAAALGYLGPGYLEPSHEPLALAVDPVSNRVRVRDLDLPHESTAERADATTATRAQARAIPGGVLDLSRESNAARAAYGRGSFGQKCLLARRLIEAGSRFVTVDDDGWDHHFRGFEALEKRLPPFDQAVATLISDLDDRGLLDKTLVVFLTEFGRTPRINREGGRDHHPGVFSVFLAGGGVRGGQVIGASDARGELPASHPITPEDLVRTLYAQLGIAPCKQYAQTALGRPMPVLEGGELIRGLV